MLNPQPAPTKEQVLAALEVTALVGELIRELGEVPSGELYARLSVSSIITESSYNAIIRTLKRAGLITDSSYLIKWVGPSK